MVIYRYESGALVYLYSELWLRLDVDECGGGRCSDAAQVSWMS
jgi:hypothetical protein